MRLTQYFNKKALLFCKFILVAAGLCFNTINGQPVNDSVFNAGFISKIELQNVTTGKTFFLTEKSTKSLILFVFLSPECPLCKNYSNKLNDLNKQYENQVMMYGIIPGKAYSTAAVKEFIQQYNIQFPLLIDHDKKLTAYLHASVTPQAILLNNENNLIYKGAIDNWAVSLGKQKLQTTEFFLRDALQQSISNKTVLIKRTKAVGCIINDY